MSAPLAMSSDDVLRFMAEAFPQSGHLRLTVERLEFSSLRVRLAIDDANLRPGGTVSGPTLMWLADAGFYMLVLARLGAGAALAVTSNLNISFLRKPALADVVAEIRFLKFGRTLCVGDVTMFSVGGTEPIAHCTLTYAMPPGLVK